MDQDNTIKHYEWEEAGKKYSSWKIITPNGVLNCGDGGMKLFMEAMKKEGFRISKELENKFGKSK